MRPRFGFTLFEMLVVVMILAGVGLTVLPYLRTADPSRLEAASGALAAALHFARDEALRTGRPTLFSLTDKARVRVFELDVSGGSPAQGPALLHPLSKHPYDVDLHTTGATAGVSTTTNLPPGPGSTGPSVAFDARGEPRNAVDLTPLAGRNVDVLLGDRARRVQLAPVTGRVTESWL